MATMKSKALKQTLKEQAERNAQVTKGTSKNQKVLKEGVPNDHSPKHHSSTPTVGISLGSTLNMGDYESLRVDVWLTDEVRENETTAQAYERIISTVDSVLNNIVEQYR